MKKDSGFLTYVTQDLMGSIPGITSRAMFGGFGLYKGGLIFAIIVDDKLYFKVDETNKGDFEQRGSKPFFYTGHNGKAYAMSYYELPQEIMDDHHALGNWIQKSLFASMKSRKKKTNKKS